ncbi:MAG: nodulation protein NfeD [Dehalococcoidia bacterium]|nr:MAG: nodulation protein NfeD [Dehalococcoidia bacterium]
MYTMVTPPFNACSVAFTGALWGPQHSSIIEGTEMTHVRRLRISFYLASICAGALALVGTATAAEETSVVVIDVEGTIVPVVAQYIERGIQVAESSGATACVIKLNTPGGLLAATEDIVSSIMNADVPVITYVSPKGAWAASAGTFITLASHLAVMTPSTTIGAAHPVSGDGQEIPEYQMEKITEFSAKWMRTIAEDRNRNIEEAVLAVTESKSFTDTQALEANLIDFRADSLASLMEQVDGLEVKLASGRVVVLDTADAAADAVDMTGFERFLHALSDPNVAYILMSLATIGLVTEISSPGLIFPGVVGGISLILAFYSLGVLDAYWGGVALMLLAAGLFVAEYFTSSFGGLTAGGVAALVLGSIVLFSRSPGIQVNRGLIIAVVAGATAFSVFILGAIIRGQRREKATGREGMIGKTALAKTPLSPRGTVLAEGELWSALAEGDAVAPGEEVTILAVDRMVLRVRRRPGQPL